MTRRVRFSVRRNWQELTRLTPDVAVSLPREASVISFGRTVFSFAACHGMHWTHLDPPAEVNRRNALPDGNRLCDVFSLDQVVAAELFFGFDERSVGDGGLATLAANRGGGRARL